MNYFITIIMALLVSFTASAQGKIGGGGYLDPPNYDYVYTDDESEGSIYPQRAREVGFILAISAQEKVCRSQNYRYLQDHKANIFKLYFDLVDLQTKFIPELLTPNLDSYYSCLFTPRVKKTLKEFLEEPDMMMYLSQNYKVPMVRVSLFMVYFQTLHFGCYTNVCHQ